MLRRVVAWNIGIFSKMFLRMGFALSAKSLEPIAPCIALAWANASTTTTDSHTGLTLLSAEETTACFSPMSSISGQMHSLSTGSIWYLTRLQNAIFQMARSVPWSSCVYQIFATGCPFIILAPFSDVLPVSQFLYQHKFYVVSRSGISPKATTPMEEQRNYTKKTCATQRLLSNREKRDAVITAGQKSKLRKSYMKSFQTFEKFMIQENKYQTSNKIS